MLFDIFNYDITTAIVSYALALGALVIFFRKSLTSLADPLFYHILWISSQASFLVIYAQANGANIVYANFAITLITYIITLWFFCALYRKRALLEKNATCVHLKSLVTLTKDRWTTIGLTLVALYLYSNKSFIEYALTCTSPQELFLFRFIDLQGREPIERILKISTYFLYLFLFISIRAKKNHKTSIAITAAMLAIAVASGGRSAVISFIVSLGAFFFLLRFESAGRSTKNVNLTIGMLYIVAIIIAATVTSFYTGGDSLANGFVVIFNRIFAAPDGIEYYLKFNGEKHIDSGAGPYITSIFGIYIQRLTEIPYKNIGWQLTELAVGDVGFAQGSNYTVLLQAVVFSHYLAPVYGMAAGWLVARMRYATPKNPRELFLVYTISIVCFTFAIDIEYFTLLIISLITVYVIIVSPILRIKVP